MYSKLKSCFKFINEIALKNKLYSLTDEQQLNLKTYFIKAERQHFDLEEVHIHIEIVTNIANFKSLTGLKNIAMYYYKIGYHQEDFWQKVAVTFGKILAPMHDFQKLKNHMFSILFIFNKKRDLLKHQQLMIHQTLKSLSPLLCNESMQNINHFVSAYIGYKIEDETIQKTIVEVLKNYDYRYATVKDIVELFYGIQTQDHEQFIAVASQLINSNMVKDSLLQKVDSIQPEYFAKLISCLAIYRVYKPELMKAMSTRLPKFKSQELAILLKTIIKGNSANYLFPILVKLREQVETLNPHDEYYIKCVQELYRQQSSLVQEQRDQLLKNTNFQEVIIENLAKYNQQDLIRILRINNMFEYDISDRILPLMHNLNIVQEIFLLYQLCTKDVNLLPYLDNIYNSLQSDQNILDPDLSYLLAVICEYLEDKYPICTKIKSLIDDQKILQFMQKAQKEAQRQALLNEHSRSSYKYLKEFNQTNIDNSLKQLGFKFKKESRVGFYLMDYRICDGDCGFDDLSDRRESGDLFIEIDGVNHFKGQDQYNQKSLIKQYILQKWNINYKVCKADFETGQIHNLSNLK